jgi:hypothetical protein
MKMVEEYLLYGAIGFGLIGFLVSLIIVLKG